MTHDFSSYQDKLAGDCHLPMVRQATTKTPMPVAGVASVGFDDARRRALAMPEDSFPEAWVVSAEKVVKVR